jgi:ATP-dependent RNA helicase DeaD
MSEESEGLLATASNMLAAAGWNSEDEAVRAVLAPASRGSNLVVVRPPSPAWALPVMAGVLAHAAAQRHRLLILTAPAMVTAMGRAVSGLAVDLGLRVVTATGLARAARRIVADEVDVLVCSPATALALQTRSTLQPERIGALVVSWPEDWDADEALTALLADLSRDSQRVVLTSDRARVDSLVERYARRALVITATLPPVPETAPPETLPVRALSASWDGRLDAVMALIESADPTEVTIWTAYQGEHAAIAAALADPVPVRLVSRHTEVRGMVICYDLPDGPTLALLSGGRDVTLLVTPGTEAYVNRLAPKRRPLHSQGALSLLLDRDAALRGRIAAKIEAGGLDAALYQLGPLFDRYDPQSVAAACLLIGNSTTIATAVTEPVIAATPVGGITNAKLWVGVGKRDEATTGDLVAVLVKEVGLAREAIGRIELRDAFTLVEVPAADAERVAKSLTGLTIRRRKVVARVDRGMPERSGGGERPPRTGGSRPGGARPGGSRPGGSRSGGASRPPR